MKAFFEVSSEKSVLRPRRHSEFLSPRSARCWVDGEEQDKPQRYDFVQLQRLSSALDTEDTLGAPVGKNPFRC